MHSCISPSSYVIYEGLHLSDLLYIEYEDQCMRFLYYIINMVGISVCTNYEFIPIYYLISVNIVPQSQQAIFHLSDLHLRVDNSYIKSYSFGMLLSFGKLMQKIKNGQRFFNIQVHSTSQCSQQVSLTAIAHTCIYNLYIGCRLFTKSCAPFSYHETKAVGKQFGSHQFSEIQL